MSITHLEFRRAGECGIPRVALLRTSVPDVRTSDLQDPARAALVLGFRDEVASRLRPAEFSDLQGLIQGLSTGIQGALAKLDQRDTGQAGPEAAGLALRLAPRPVYLAGREELLADLDARLGGDDRAGPRVAVLYGLGGAGKTSVAVEYAHRHLAEVGVCWQFPAEDPAVLAAEFAVLAAELGAREVVDPRDPVASVHAVLARASAGWLVVFDNVPDRVSVARFVPVFRARQTDLLGRGETAGHPADVAATLGLALSRLADEAPAAAGLMRVLAFLAPEPVPLALLLASEQAAGLLGPEVAAAVGPLLGDPVAAGDAITALRRYSLVSPAGDGLVLVHRLVQAITRAQLTAQALGQWEQAAAALVQMAVPADPELPAAWPVCTVLLPHARAVLDLTSRGMWRIARYLGNSGSSPAARDQWLLIADAHRDSAAYGPEHSDTLNARHNLAVWTGEAGDAAGARDQLAALLPIRERVLGPEHPGTLITRNQLARWTGRAGNAAGARHQHAALLPISERVLGPEHPDTLTARNQLAFWTGEAGNAAGARDQFAALLPIRERVQGPGHPHTLITRNQLARWTGRAGDAAPDAS